MSQELVYERGIEDAKQFARIMYVAHAATFFFSLGLLNVLVLIVNYIRRPDTSGTIAWMRPICIGSMLLMTVPRYFPNSGWPLIPAPSAQSRSAHCAPG